MVELKDVLFKFEDGNDYVLKHINLQIKEGDFTLIVGNVKSGKTTLFRLLKDELELKVGHILLNKLDTSLYSKKEIYKDFAFMPEMISFEDCFTVKDNMMLMNRHPQTSYEECLDKLGIRSLLNKPIIFLNGLERRQVYLAAMLTFNPKVLVVDDISSNLDNTRAEILYQDLAKLNQEGLTILAFTKHRAYASFFKKSYYLENGHLI